MNFIHTNVTLLLKIPKFPHFGSTLKNKIIKVFLGDVRMNEILAVYLYEATILLQIWNTIVPTKNKNKILEQYQPAILKI